MNPAVTEAHPMTVSEFAEHWLSTYCRPPYKAAYLERSRRMAFRRYFNPAIGEIHLEDVTTGALSSVQRGMFAKGLKLSTVRTTFGFFAEMWKAARGEGLVRGKPYSDLVWPSARRSKPTVFTREERDTILAEAVRQRVWWLPQAACMLLAGMRPSEAAGLRWHDFDPDSGRIEIARGLVCREETGCKHGKAVRNIVAAPDLIDILLAARPHGAQDDDLMNMNAAGGSVNSGSFSGAHWRPLLAYLNLDYRSAYTARHTFITLAIMDGANPALVAEYCGTSIQEIERSYLSWIGAIRNPSLSRSGTGLYAPRARQVVQARFVPR